MSAILSLSLQITAFSLAPSGAVHVRERAGPVRMSEPNPVLGVASLGMGLIKPIFRAEAALQAAVMTLGSDEKKEEARAQIEQDKKKAPVVVYTYGLSPFSTECKSFLDGLGCKYEAVELGPEWFLLGPKASAMREELAATTGQSSLPHVFIGGKSVGGLYSGNDEGEGLASLQKSGELTTMLKKARAL